jgi:LppX_LprAFG lipoprotein
MRPILSHRAAATGVASALLMAALVGCASSDSQATDEPLATSSSPASAPTDEAEPSDAAVASTAPAQGDEVDAEEFVARVERGLKNTKYAHLTFELSQSGSSMTGTGDVDYTSVPADMSMTMEFGAQQLEMRLVDKVMYLSAPAAKGKFIAFDLDDPSNPLGQDFVSQMDPAKSLQTFAAAVKKVTFVGEEEADGQTLQRYQMLVTTAELAKQGTSQLPDELTMGVWLDDKDRMAKSFVDLGAASYQATLSDFDKPVTVEAPGPDLIVSR